MGDVYKWSDITDTKPVDGSKIWNEIHESIFDPIDSECKAYSEGDNEVYHGCLRFIRREIWERISFNYTQRVFGVTGMTREREFDVLNDVFPLAPSNPDIVRNMINKTRDDCKNVTEPKKRHACIVLNTLKYTRAFIAGLFAGSKPPENLALPTKKSGKIEITKETKEIFNSALSIGNRIRDNCLAFAETYAENNEDKKYAYKACRETLVFRTLGQSGGRVLDTAMLRRAPKELRLITKEKMSALSQELKDITDEMVDGALKKLKILPKQQVKNDDLAIHYYIGTSLRRKYGSIFGSATREV